MRVASLCLFILLGFALESGSGKRKCKLGDICKEIGATEQLCPCPTTRPLCKTWIDRTRKLYPSFCQHKRPILEGKRCDRKRGVCQSNLVCKPNGKRKNKKTCQKA